MSGEKVLITGGGGFIGLAVAKKLLQDGQRVDLLDNFSRGRNDAELRAVAANPMTRVITGNMVELVANGLLDHDYHYIFHFAALLGVQNVLERPYETLFGNIVLTDAAISLGKRQKHLKRLIFSSTSEVYAGSAEMGGMTIPTPESEPLMMPQMAAPRTSYMLSKICGESMCHYAGLPVTIVRPHNVYGPRMGMSHVIPQMLERAHKLVHGDSFDVFSADHTRTFCFIDDAVEIATRAAVSPDCIGQVLNLGCAAPEITIRTLADMILEATGRSAVIAEKPAHAGSPGRRCPDMTKTSQLIGFEAKTSLQVGIQRTYDWYRQNVFAIA